MFYQLFLSPQVKRWAIITFKNGIYQLPDELPHDLREGGGSIPTQEKKKDFRKLGN